MLFKDTIQLVTVASSSTNDYGDPIDTETLTTVYANKKSIRQSEFYQSMASGIKPELMFMIRDIDYNNEETLIYNSKRYQIDRVFSKNNELTELVCSGLVV